MERLRRALWPLNRSMFMRFVPNVLPTVYLVDARTGQRIRSGDWVVDRGRYFEVATGGRLVLGAPYDDSFTPRRFVRPLYGKAGILEAIGSDGRERRIPVMVHDVGGSAVTAT